MKIGILHLSDIHIENDDDWILGKAEAIGMATAGNLSDEGLDVLAIAVSGDIANKGYASQYHLAHGFFTSIASRIKGDLGIPVHFVLVPGNHDCDFGSSDDYSIRELSIDSILGNPETVIRGNKVYKECLSVQQNFFEFAKLLAEGEFPREPEAFYQIRIPVKGGAVLFNCFNTAWLTRNPETQGRLVMPTVLARAAEARLPDDLLAFSIYHHPDNWLSSENANDFKPIIERVSDVTLTGHEHNREAFTRKEVHFGSEVVIQKAAALQERGSLESSGFSTLLFDLENFQMRFMDHDWDAGRYTTKRDSGWKAFNRNKHLLRGRFGLTTHFRNWVTDLDGTPITHSRKAILKISDLFIRPRLRIYSLEEIMDGKVGEKTIGKDDFELFIAERQKVLLYGETLQGKTTAAKFLFTRFHARYFSSVFEWKRAH